jgi:glycogen synthase
MKVLITADTLGGVWTYALELTRALPEVQFALCTMGGPADATELPPNVELFESSYALEWMDNPWDDVDRAGEWLLQLARDFEPDVVHLNGYAHAALPWNVPVIVVAHSCVFSWWRAVKGGEPPQQYAEYHRRVSSGLAAADLVVAPTAAMLDSLGENYSFFGERRVIWNARDPQQFAPGEKRNVIFAAGRMWDEAKNLAALEAVAPQVAWPIEVAGDTVHPNGSTQQFQHVDLLDRLTAAQLRQQLATSAIYAFPARYEPFGLSILEAALSGCALVLGDIPTLREVWGDAAKFVHDSSSLAAALGDLINDADQREEFARRAMNRAAEFSPQKMADAYRDAYSHCLTRKTAETAA